MVLLHLITEYYPLFKNYITMIEMYHSNDILFYNYILIYQKDGSAIS